EPEPIEPEPIEPEPSNNAPQISGPITDQQLCDDESISLTLTTLVTDADGDPLTFSLATSTPSWAHLDGPQLTISSPTIGSHDITLTASDGRGGSVEVAIPVTVTRAPHHLLVIVADDIGREIFDFCSESTGKITAVTPRLSQLASDGVTFEQSWVMPACSPTRASLLSGQHPSTHEVRTASDRLSATTDNLARRLSEAGYRSAAFGKWHLSAKNKPRHPNTFGFDHFDGYLGSGPQAYDDWSRVVNGVESTCQDYQTSQMSDAAITWLADAEASASDQPWLVWMAYAAAHTPYHAPPAGTYTTPLPAAPSNFDYFIAMTESLDQQLGRVIDSLSDKQRRRCTIIVISDNGSPGPIAQQAYKQRAKGTLYQGGINTTWIINGRAVERSPGLSSELTSAVDLMPTLLDLAAVTAPADLPGHSLGPVLRGAASSRTALFSETYDNTSGTGSWVYLANGYKLHRHDVGDDELYHLASDPTEAVNLLADGISAAEAAIIAELAAGGEAIYRPRDDGSDPIAGFGYAIVDTGQTQCYDSRGNIAPAPAPGEDRYGQDAQHQGFQPSYLANGDGTISDLVTGLTWSQSPDLNGDGIIDAGDQLNHSDALAYAATLSLAGHQDWRVPSVKELYSLIDFRGKDPSGWSGSDTNLLTPFINDEIFAFAYGDTSAGARIIDAQFVTTTLSVAPIMNGNGESMFGVNFADGRIKGYPTKASKTYYALFVRGASYGSNDFSDNGDGTISDHASQLMWQQADSGVGMDWPSALAWVEARNAENHLGYNDWRLPNAKELHSIVDYNRSLLTTDSAAIDPLFSCSDISDEAGNLNFPFYHTSTTHANMNKGNSAVYLAFGQALGWMEDQSGGYNLLDVHGAGAQRSDPKIGNPADYPYGHGPQGDVIRINNYVRMVRDLASSPLRSVGQ
ncbi:MAG: sulfatase-like hydrolase/transferase, partial [Planctomycetota bacterium]